MLQPTVSFKPTLAAYVAKRCINKSLFKIKYLFIDDLLEKDISIKLLKDIAKFGFINGYISLNSSFSRNGDTYTMRLMGNIRYYENGRFAWDCNEEEDFLMADLSDYTCLLQTIITDSKDAIFCSLMDNSQIFAGKVGWVSLNDIIKTDDATTKKHLNKFTKKCRKIFKAARAVNNMQ